LVSLALAGSTSEHLSWDIAMLKFLVAAAVAGSITSTAVAGSVFGAPSYTSNLTLQSASAVFVPTAVTFSNGLYYTGYGNGTNSPFVKLDAAGNILSSVRPAPGMEFRSLFTDAAGDVFARDYQINYIWKEGSFGTWKTFQAFTGPFQVNSQVVLDSTGTHYVGNNGGTLQFWDLSGAKTRTVVLAAGASTGVVSIYGNYALSYNTHGLNAYDLDTGALVDTTQLTGVNPGPYALNYGQSYTSNGYFFIAAPDGSFSGFQIGLPSSAVPEPATWALLIAGFGTVGTAMRRRRPSSVVA